MATGFLDLPSELRNRIYQLYADKAPKRHPLRFCNGKIMPPPLAYVSRQVRTEMLSFLSGKRADLHGIQHLEARVYNLDFEPLKTFLEGDRVRPSLPIFSGRIVLVFTERWRPSKTRGRLQEWMEWCTGYPRVITFAQYTVIAHWAGVSIKAASPVSSILFQGKDRAKAVEKITGMVSEAREVAERDTRSSKWAVRRLG